MAAARRTAAAKDRRAARRGRRSVARASAQQIIRLGGRLIDVTGWPEEVLDRIRRDYLMPPALKRLFMARVTLAASCPARHITEHNIGVLADTAETVRRISDGMPKARILVNCTECGRQASVTGKNVYWTGPLSEWDGAI